MAGNIPEKELKSYVINCSALDDESKTMLDSAGLYLAGGMETSAISQREAFTHYVIRARRERIRQGESITERPKQYVFSELLGILEGCSCACPSFIIEKEIEPLQPTAIPEPVQTDLFPEEQSGAEQLELFPVTDEERRGAVTKRYLEGL